MTSNPDENDDYAKLVDDYTNWLASEARRIVEASESSTWPELQTAAYGKAGVFASLAVQSELRMVRRAIERLADAGLTEGT